MGLEGKSTGFPDCGLSIARRPVSLGISSCRLVLALGWDALG